MRKNNSMVVISLLLGLAGLGFHALQVSRSFDPLTNLPISGDIFGPLFVGVSVASLSLLLLLARRTPQGNPPPHFTEKHNIVIISGMLLMGISAVLYIFESFGGAVAPAALVLGIFSAIMGLCAFISISTTRKITDKERAPLSLVPICYCIVWIILYYRNYASDPVLWHYWCPLLAISALAMGFYYTSSALYGQYLEKRSIFFSAAAIYLCLAALPGSSSPAVACAYLGCALFQLATLLRITAQPEGDA